MQVKASLRGEEIRDACRQHVQRLFPHSSLGAHDLVTVESGNEQAQEPVVDNMIMYWVEVDPKDTPTVGPGREVHVVTFEGAGSGGFNWFPNYEDAFANFNREKGNYMGFPEVTIIALFSVHVPEFNQDSAQARAWITRWLEVHDVYGLSDKAQHRVRVGHDTVQEAAGAAHPGNQENADDEMEGSCPES